MELFLSLAGQIQEGQTPGFDSMPEPAYGLSWEERLFVLYLLVVFLIASIKSLSVARQLLWFSAKKRWTSSENPGNAVSDAYALAAAALANRLSWDFLGHDWNISAGGLKVEASSHLLPPAERTFRYAWERCSAKVSSLKRLVFLTLLSSVLIWRTVRRQSSWSFRIFPRYERGR
jgi:hypothetical protein